MKNKLKLMADQQKTTITELIVSVLNKHDGNQSAAAIELGVTQSTVSYWMLKSGLKTKRVVVAAFSGSPE